ncbi:MAG: tetratricopeptide repeat protein, partial [Rickettsiales bacterium]
MSAAVNKKLKKARSLLGAKKYQQAFALFSEVLKLSPNQPEALHHLALFAQAQGDHGKAMQLLSAATQHAPKYHEAHYDLGVMYEKAGNIGKAADHYMAAWQLSPDMKHYLYGFAKVVEPMRFT